MNHVVLFFLIVCTFVSCSSTVSSKDDLIAYLKDDQNGLHKKVEKGNSIIEVIYKPAQLVWAGDLQSKDAQAAIDSLIYFSISFSQNGKAVERNYATNPELSKSMVDYLAFDIANDLYLTTKQDTLYAVDVIYPKGLTDPSRSDITAIFFGNLNNVSGVIDLVIDDQKLGVGYTVMSFESKDLKNVPTLK